MRPSPSRKPLRRGMATEEPRAASTRRSALSADSDPQRSMTAHERSGEKNFGAVHVVSLAGTSMGAEMMTTVWRPRVRIDVPDVGDADKTDTSREESTKKGTKRKYAPRHYGPCEHGVKPRSKCKVCRACPHGRRRTRCKECGGPSVCEHGRERSTCKECGGGSVCEHGRQRSRCKECGGSQICEHGRRRHRCKECR